jgi:pyruvate formate lyase activating enzyme
VKIGGLQKLTLIDYPQKVACTVFLSGCNFRCSWCYSPELVLPEKIKEHPEIETGDFFDFLEKRKGKLDGVVVCGGEPTIHKELPDFIGKIKEKGFLVKIDTNGSNPEALKDLVNKGLLDYIAMDIKLPLLRYKELAEGIDSKIKKSVTFIMKSETEYEFRTTIVPGIHEKEDIKKIGELISGAKRYYLQNFLPEKTIDEGFLMRKPFLEKEIEEFKNIVSSFVEKCETR